jgi:1,2-phenylacetyl-CoA epoxidase catalytic subunit
VSRGRNEHTRDDAIDRARVEYLLRLGDSDLILGQRLTAWIGHAPVLEEELAIGNVALDLIGQSRLWLSYAAEREGAGRDEDELAYFRQPHEFRNLLLVERPNDDFAHTMTRQYFYDAWHLGLLRALAGSGDERIAAIAAKGAREVAYHVERPRATPACSAPSTTCGCTPASRSPPTRSTKPAGAPAGPATRPRCASRGWRRCAKR